MGGGDCFDNGYVVVPFVFYFFWYNCKTLTSFSRCVSMCSGYNFMVPQFCRLLT